MKSITPKILEIFIQSAAKQLDGEWVLIGGTVLPALGLPNRPTLDIDIIPLDDNDRAANTLKVMEIAEELGLPVEAINFAGEFFLRKVEGFRDRLQILHQNEKFTLYRPDAYLFIKLKSARLNQSDLEDCLSMLNSEHQQLTPTEIGSLIGQLGDQVNPSNEQVQRIQILIEALQELL